MADPVITTLRILGTRAYINGARASARAIRDVGKAGEETHGGMQLLKGSLGAVTGALGILMSAAKSTGLVLGALGLYGAKVGIEFDAAIERSTVGMTTLLGSAKKARKVVAEVQAFAVKAPMLSVADAIQSTQMLLGAGMKAGDSVKTMTAFSDTLSAMGRRPEDLSRMTYAFQQMMSKGKVTAEELRGQLGEIFPASKLMAKGMGISMAELAKKMKAGEVRGMKPIRILLGEMEKEFGGATARSAKTFTGMMNNMKENAKVTLGLIFKPLFYLLRDDIFPWVNKISQGIQDWAKKGGAQRLINQFKHGLKGPPTKVGRVPLGQRGNVDFAPRNRQAAPRSPLEKIAKGAGSLIRTVMPQLIKYFKQFWDALKPAEPFLKNVLAPLVLGFGKGLLAGIIALIPVIKIVAQALGWIGTQAKPLKKVFEDIGFVLGFVFGPGKLGLFKPFGAMFKVIGGLVGKLAPIFGKLAPIFEFVAGGLRRFWATARTIIELWLGSWGRAVGAISGFAGKIVRIGLGIVTKIVKGFFSLGGKIASGVSGAVGAVVSAFVNMGVQIGTALGDAIWGVLPGWLQKLLGGGVGFVKSLIGGGGDKKPAGPGISNHTAKFRAHPAGMGGPAVTQAQANALNIQAASPKPNKGIAMPPLVVNSTTHVNVDGREIGRAVANDTSNKKARR